LGYFSKRNILSAVERENLKGEFVLILNDNEKRSSRKENQILT